MAIKHVKVATVADDGTSEVGTDEWNDNHTIDNNTITDDMVAAHTTTKIIVPVAKITGLSTVATSGAAADISGLATSATTDTTSATNITSGTLPVAQLPTVTIAKGGSGQTTQQTAVNALTAVSGATAEHVLTKDTSTGNAIFKAAGGGSDIELVYDDENISVTGTTGRTITCPSSNRAWYKVFITYYNSTSHELRLQCNSGSGSNYSVRHEMYSSYYTSTTANANFMMHGDYTYRNSVFCEFTINSGDFGALGGNPITGSSSSAETRYNNHFQCVFGGVCNYGTSGGLSTMKISNSAGTMSGLSIKVYAPK